MTKTKKILGALAMVASLGALTPAHAQLVNDLGSAPGTFAIGSFKPDRAFKLLLDPGTYTFSVALYSADFAMDNVWLSNEKDLSSTGVDDFFTVSIDTIVNNKGQTVERAKGTFQYTVTGPVGVKQSIFLMADTTGGTGTSTQGTYTVTAVPEPASTALFLAGLGALGLLARRRQTRG